MRSSETCADEGPMTGWSCFGSGCGFASIPRSTNTRGCATWARSRNRTPFPPHNSCSSSWMHSPFPSARCRQMVAPSSPSASQKVPGTTKRCPGSSFGNMASSTRRYAPARHGTTARWNTRTERTTRRLMRATSSIPLRISRGSWLGAIESAMHSRCVHWAGIPQTNVWGNIWLSVTQD